MDLSEMQINIHQKAQKLVFLYRRYYGYVPSLVMEIMNATTPNSTRKYNQNHDPDNGRFTSGSNGGNSTDNQNHPTVTENSRNEIAINNPDGSTEIRTGGSRSWRNNNPGNIVAGSFADNHGTIGEAGGFAVFPDEQTGQDASTALLQSPAYSDLTINQAIARRSPPGDNNTVAVQAAVNRIGRFSGGEIISDLTPDRLSRLTGAIQRVEGWWPGTVRQMPASH
jgi:hypothetical protein